MTEDEHIKLVEEGNTFCLELANIAADVLLKFRSEIRDEVMVYLQDCTSLYSPFTADAIQERLE